jgi:HD-like signal output (HDOD) protein
MASDRMKQVLDDIRNLRPWPPVAGKVLEISRQDNVVPSDLVGVLLTDAALTARVLKLTNSAYYGFQREVGSLSEAANRLGTDALVSLVLTSCVGQSYFAGAGQSDSHTRRMWEYSVMNGLAASRLASINGKLDRNLAYTAGLLQDIGNIVLDTHLHEMRHAIRAEREQGASSLEAERTVIGFDHAQIGARLMRGWHFPEFLVDTVHYHHSPEKARENPLLASLVNLGASVTEAVAMGEGLHSLAYTLSDSALGVAGLTFGQMERLESVLVADLGRARDLVQKAA